MLPNMGITSAALMMRWVCARPHSRANAVHMCGFSKGSISIIAL